MSMAHGPLLDAVARHVSSTERATFLPTLGIIGQTAFSLVLVMLCVPVVGKDALNWLALSQVLGSAVIGGFIALVLLCF